MSSNFSKKCLKHTHTQNFQIVEDSRSTNGSLENYPINTNEGFISFTGSSLATTNASALVTKYSFSNNFNSSFNKNRSLLSSRARFSRLPFKERESSTTWNVHLISDVCLSVTTFWSKAKQNVYCHISFISQPIAVKFCRLLLLIQSNKPYDTTPHLYLSI